MTYIVAAATWISIGALKAVTDYTHIRECGYMPINQVRGQI